MVFLNRRVAAIVAGLTVVAMLGAGFGTLRYLHHAPPYGPEAIGASATLREVTYEEAVAAVGDGVPVVYPGDELVLGRITWRPPPQRLAGGYYAIYVIDKRTNRKPEVFAFASPAEDSVGMGGGGIDHRVSEVHPWLAGAGSVETDNGWTTSGNRLYVSAGDASPLTFVAKFPHIERPMEPWVPASAPIDIADLLVGFVYIGPKEQIYWALRLYG